MTTTKKTAKQRETEIKTELCEILKVREKFLTARLFGLGFGDPCTRCGGSGEYSYCQQYGTRCFKCGGNGKQSPRFTRKLVNAVREAVDAGKLDAYLERLRIIAAGKRAVKEFFAAWGTNPTLADEKARGVHWHDSAAITCGINFIGSALNTISQHAERQLTTAKTMVERTTAAATLSACTARVATIEKQMERAGISTGKYRSDEARGIKTHLEAPAEFWTLAREIVDFPELIGVDQYEKEIRSIEWNRKENEKW